MANAMHLNLNRRSLLAAIAASSAGLAAGQHIRVRPRRHLGGYTARTAPDALGRAVLAKTLTRLDQGKLAGQSMLDATRANMQQLIEQNVARLDPARIKRLVGLAPMHKRLLAQVYVNATVNSSRSPALYDLLATRMTGAQLGAAAEYFGFVPLYEAVNRAAPAKLREFERTSSAQWMSPNYGARPVIPMGAGQFLDMPLGDIWIAVRLAPIGLYSLPASTFMFATALSGPLTMAWAGGQYLGTTVIAPLIQTVAPSLWDRIGEGIGYFIDQLHVTPPDDQGPIQELAAGAMLFDLEPALHEVFEATGGDYGINEAWAEYADWGGSGGGDFDDDWFDDMQ
jgi:hypothetical protein